MKLLFLTYLICIGLSVSTFAQTNTVPYSIRQQPVKVLKKEAQRLYEEKKYAEAYPYYQLIKDRVKFFSKKNQYKLAKCALAAKKYKIAELALALLSNKPQKFPMARYEYALSLKNQGSYSRAVNEFTSISKSTQSIKLSQTCAIHIQACEKALADQSKITAWTVRKTKKTTGDSTISYRAISTPTMFTYRLIECETPEGTCLKRVYPNDEILPINGRAGNPMFNSSAPCVDPDGKTIYFTQQEISATGVAEYKIYRGESTKSGAIINIKKLGNTINQNGHSSLHPTIANTIHGQKILYFASSLPGTQGGFDIWFAIQTSDKGFTKAYNLGSRINTANDEVTPFYFQKDGELYFSSERPNGFGGLDVYKMTGDKKRWREHEAKHLSNPVNSHGNDTHFILQNDSEIQLSTDRSGKENILKIKKPKGA